MYRHLARELYTLIARYSQDHADLFDALFMAHYRKTNPTENEQIRDINTFWRYRLGILDADTRRARQCLLDNVDADVWLHNFEHYVMEAVIHHTIPYQPCLTRYALL